MDAIAWVYFFANPPDILLTPRVHDFYRAQGEGSGSGGADTIAIYDEGGRQQRRRAIYILSIFFFNPTDILLIPCLHDSFRAQGGGSGGSGCGTTITQQCGHDRDLLQGGAAAAAAGYSRWVYFYFFSPDILLTPASMIFSEHRGGAAVAAVRTRSIYDEGGWQQRQRAI